MLRVGDRDVETTVQRMPRAAANGRKQLSARRGAGLSLQRGLGSLEMWAKAAIRSVLECLGITCQHGFPGQGNGQRQTESQDDRDAMA